MKRNVAVALVLLMLCLSVSAQAEVPQLSGDLYNCAKQATVYLASGEYERLVTLLPFSDVAPSASEWQNFAEGNFTSLAGEVQTDYAVAYWMGETWNLAIPTLEPNDPSVEALVLSSTDGTSFSGYRYAVWSQIEEEYLSSSYVLWNKEYVDATPIVAAD